MRLLLFALNCLLGLFAVIGLLTFAGLASLVWVADEHFDLAGESSRPPPVSVLYVNLTGGILDLPPSSPLAQAALAGVPDLLGLLESMEAAAGDPSVKGILLQAGRGPLGMAEAQELHAAILSFRESGKPVTVFAESFGEGGDPMSQYLLASAADEVWLQPSGELETTGFALENPFLKRAFDALGVAPQMAARHEFKGAVSIFTEESLPEPQRQNLGRLLESWMDQWVETVATARELSPEALRALVDAAPLDAALALKEGLVDQTGYWDQVSDRTLAQASVGAVETAELFDIALYRDFIAEPLKSPEAQVALIHGLGPIVLGTGEYNPLFGEVSMGSDDVAGALAEALEDSTIDAIVLRVDSPGGSYLASDVIWREVARAAEFSVPVIISMGDIAASGGYFVAAPATAIVAQPGTITGSIGVAGGKFALEGLWEKLQVQWDGVSLGKNAELWSGNRPFDAAGWERLERSLDRTYADFTAKVASGRGLSDDKLDEAARGRVWSGEDALERGLIDRFGGYREAFALVREKLDLAPDAALEIRRLPEPLEPWEALLADFSGGGFASQLREAANLAEMLAAMDRRSGGQLTRLLRTKSAREPMLETWVPQISQ